MCKLFSLFCFSGGGGGGGGVMSVLTVGFFFMGLLLFTISMVFLSKGDSLALKFPKA